MNARKEMGQGAEELAARYLEQKGYEVLARNFSVRRGEVDIVAEKGELLCFVEVRSRATELFGHPSETVLPKKQRRVVRAAMEYMFRCRSGERAVRFDVISVVRERSGDQVLHIENAFDAGI